LSQYTLPVYCDVLQSAARRVLAGKVARGRRNTARTKQTNKQTMSHVSLSHVPASQLQLDNSANWKKACQVIINNDHHIY